MMMMSASEYNVCVQLAAEEGAARCLEILRRRMLTPPRHVIESTILLHISKQWGDTPQAERIGASHLKERLLHMAAIAVGVICNVEPPELSVYNAYFCGGTTERGGAALVATARVNAIAAAAEARVATAAAKAARTEATAAEAEAAQTWLTYCRLGSSDKMLFADDDSSKDDRGAAIIMMEMDQPSSSSWRLGAEQGKKKRATASSVRKCHNSDMPRKRACP